jgi:hypothetical protein
MPAPLFEDLVPPEFATFHFMIRGWISPKGRPNKNKFDTFIKKVAGKLLLKTAEVVLQDENVAFVCHRPFTGWCRQH